MFGDDTKIKIVFTKKARTDKIVKTIMKLRVPLMVRHLLNIQATVSLLEAAVYCEVWIPHFGKEFMVFSFQYLTKDGFDIQVLPFSKLQNTVKATR
jgi:hypothetical protein